MQITHGPMHFEKKKEYIFDLISKLVFSGKLFIKKIHSKLSFVQFTSLLCKLKEAANEI